MCIRDRLLIDGVPRGFLGELHPRLARHYEFPLAPVVFELALEPLLAATVPQGAAVSRFPIVRRDIAVIVDEGVAAGELTAALEAAKPPHVVNVVPIDVFRGPGLPPGQKSVAILVLMQDTARTLTDTDIDATVASLVDVLRQRFDATLRQ